LYLIVDAACRYKSVKSANASACNPTTNQKEISQVLVSGDDTKCEKTKAIYKPCGKGGARGGKAGKKGQKAERMDDSPNKQRGGRKNKTTVAPGLWNYLSCSIKCEP